MFHECKIYDGKGKLKVTYTKEQVSSVHWHNTIENNNQITFSETGNVVPGIVKGTRRTVICAYSDCNKSFITTHRKAKVCSDLCSRYLKRDKDAKRRRLISKNKNFTPPQQYENGFFGYKITCKQCETIAYKKNYKAMFCSPKCLNKHKNYHYISKRIPHSIVCAACDKKVSMKSSAAKYCSEKCRRVARAKRNNTTNKTW